MDNGVGDADVDVEVDAVVDMDIDGRVDVFIVRGSINVVVNVDTLDIGVDVIRALVIGDDVDVDDADVDVDDEVAIRALLGVDVDRNIGNNACCNDSNRV